MRDLRWHVVLESSHFLGVLKEESMTCLHRAFGNDVGGPHVRDFDC